MTDSNIVPDFRTLMAAPLDSFEKPKALPNGHYIGSILNHAFDRSKKKQTAFVRFSLRPEEPGPDVIATEIDGIDLKQRELTKDYYITPKAMGILRSMVEAVHPNSAGRSADELIPELRGARVMFGVTQRPDDRNPSIIYNDVTDIVAAPAA